MPKGKGGGSKAAEKSGGAAEALGTCSQVKVRHILCEKHSKVMEALSKIQEGERFETVAQSYSEDAARKGGDLGWKRRNELVGPFADAAFKLQVVLPFSNGTASTTLNYMIQPDKHGIIKVGQMSEPIKTQFGYHIILCEGRKA